MAPLDPSQVLAPLVPALVPVPAVQPGVCRICRGSVSDFTTCRQCASAERLLGGLPEVLPLAMSVRGGPLHAVLANYKRSASSEVRRRSSLQLGALLALGIRRHGSCIGEFDAVTTVPSERGDAPWAVVGLVSELRDIHVPITYLQSTERVPDRGRYGVPQALSGARVLLIDDTLTSGASIFSACAALNNAGAASVAPLVLGRHLRPDYPDTKNLLSWLSSCSWSEGACGRCGGAQNPAPIRPMF